MLRAFWDESSPDWYSKSLNKADILRYTLLFSCDFILQVESTGEYWDEIDVTTFPASMPGRLNNHAGDSRPQFVRNIIPPRSSNLVFFPPAPHTLKGEGRFFCEEETEGMGEGFMHGCCGRGAGRRGIFGSGEISSAEAVFADHRWGCAADFCKG